MSSYVFGRHTSHGKFALLLASVLSSDSDSYGLPILWNLNVMDSIKKEWDDAQDTIFYVVDRHKGGLIAKYKVWL